MANHCAICMIWCTCWLILVCAICGLAPRLLWGALVNPDNNIDVQMSNKPFCKPCWLFSTISPYLSYFYQSDESSVCCGVLCHKPLTLLLPSAPFVVWHPLSCCIVLNLWTFATVFIPVGAVFWCGSSKLERTSMWGFSLDTSLYAVCIFLWSACWDERCCWYVTSGCKASSWASMCPLACQLIWLIGDLGFVAYYSESFWYPLRCMCTHRFLLWSAMCFLWGGGCGGKLVQP